MSEELLPFNGSVITLDDDGNVEHVESALVFVHGDVVARHGIAFGLLKHVGPWVQSWDPEDDS